MPKAAEFIESAFSSQLEVNDAKAPDAFVFLPAGKHVIYATINGKPGKREVLIDASAAEAVQRDFEATEGSRRFGDFDHERKKASFWPTGFYWEEGKGVMVKPDWSKSGREAVESKDYRYFSPSFARDPESGKVIGLHRTKPIGGLVNEPAFQTFEQIAAAHADDFSGEPPQTNKQPTMKLTELVDAGVLTTAEAESENVGKILAEKWEASKKQMETVTASAGKARKELKDLKDEVEAKESQAIEAELSEHVEAGVIEADEKEFWAGLLKADGVQARKTLAKLAGKDDTSAKKGPERVMAGKTAPKPAKPDSSKVKTEEEFVNAMLDLVNEKKFKSFEEAIEAHAEEYEQVQQAALELIN